MIANRNTTLDQVMDLYRDLEEAGKVAEGLKDPRYDKRKKAEEEARELAFKVLDTPETPYDSPDDIEAENVEKGLNLSQRMSQAEAVKVFSDNLDEIVSELPEGVLSRIGRVKEIVEEIAEDHPEYANLMSLDAHRRLYAERQGELEELGSDKESSKKYLNKLDKKEKEALLAGSAEALSEKRRQDYKDSGDEHLADLAAEAAQLAVQSGHVTTEILRAGAEYLEKELADELSERESELGRKVGSYVQDAIKDMAKGSGKEFVGILDLLYRSYEKESKGELENSVYEGPAVAGTIGKSSKTNRRIAA